VVCWLFFAVGFTEKGMSALHELVLTGNQDFNDPVFWFACIILPVNTITEETKRMLPECIHVTFRSPTNRKAHQLWHCKVAMSCIKTIVVFGEPGTLNPTMVNATTQPWLDAMVKNKKCGKEQHNAGTSQGRNHHVSGMTRAFLISFPKKHKDWADAVVKKKKKPPEMQSVDKSDKPCDVHLDPTTVWKSYQPSGVFKLNAKCDMPSDWDPCALMCLINKGDTRMAECKTKTLELIATNVQDATSRKRKNKGDSYFRVCTTTDSQQTHNFSLLQTRIAGK
jgi:hypothetical protein